MQKLIVVMVALLSLISTPAIPYQHQPDTYKIYSAIKVLTPSVPDVTAYAYASIIDRYSKEYSIDWKVGLVIFKQESNFNLGAVNYKSFDFGIGQMHHRTIQNRKIDLGQLLTNADYAIGETFKLLAELRDKYDKIDKVKKRKWYTRYHSYTPSNRDNYRVLLDNHLAKIEGLFNEREERGSKAGSGSKKAISGRAKAYSEKVFRGIAQDRSRDM
jgi:hypothetical protein